MGVSNVSAVQQQPRYVDPYLAYANMSSMIDGDGTFMGMQPLCSPFGNSVFGNNFGMNGMYGMGGMNGMYNPMCGLGPCNSRFGPGSEVMNMSQIDYLRYQENIEEYMLKKQVRQHKMAGALEFSSQAHDDTIARQIGVLSNLIKENEQDKFIGQYEKLITLTKEKLAHEGIEHATREQIKARAEKLYFESTGRSMVDDLTENGDGGFVQGLKQGVGVGVGSYFANTRNYKDNIAEITGEEKSKSDNAWKWVGRFLAGGISILGLVFGAKGISALRAGGTGAAGTTGTAGTAGAGATP